MVVSNAGLSLLCEALHRQTCFVDHQCAAQAQGKDSRGAGDNSHDGGEFEHEFLAIVSGDGATHRNESGGRKKSQTCVIEAKRFQQQLCANLQRLELFCPIFAFAGPRCRRGDVICDDTGAIDNAAEPVTCAESENRGGIGEDRRCNDGGEDGKWSTSEGLILHGEATSRGS
jgi:hypothetical protein